VGDDDSPRGRSGYGILSQMTRGNGWDVPAEAWCDFLAKAYEAQGWEERERECLELAVRVVGEGRCAGDRE
jgi:hypothetical protein